MKVETKNWLTVGAWTAIAVVMALLFFGPDRGVETSDRPVNLANTAHAQEPETTKPAETPKPAKIITNCDDELAKKRASWNEKKGNNYEAAFCATGLQQIYGAMGLTKDNIAFYLTLHASDEAEQQFKRGCSLKKYQSAVEKGELVVGVDSRTWRGFTDSQKSELLVVCWFTIKNTYPNASTAINIFDENANALGALTAEPGDDKPNASFE